MEECDIVYEGYKFFEKFQRKLEVVVINHPEYYCLEIIVYGFNRKSNRNVSKMYIDSELLLTKIDLRMFNDTLLIRQNALRRKKQTYDNSELMKSIAMGMMINMLRSRLEIIDIHNCGVFDIYLEHFNNDYGEMKTREDGSEYAELDFQFECCPQGMVPFKDLKRRQSEKSPRTPTLCTSPCSPYKSSKLLKIRTQSIRVSLDDVLPQLTSSKYSSSSASTRSCRTPSTANTSRGGSTNSISLRYNESSTKTDMPTMESIIPSPITSPHTTTLKTLELKHPQQLQPPVVLMVIKQFPSMPGAASPQHRVLQGLISPGGRRMNTTSPRSTNYSPHKLSKQARTSSSIDGTSTSLLSQDEVVPFSPVVLLTSSPSSSRHHHHLGSDGNLLPQLSPLSHPQDLELTRQSSAQRISNSKKSSEKTSQNKGQQIITQLQPIPQQPILSQDIHTIQQIKRQQTPHQKTSTSTVLPRRRTLGILQPLEILRSVGLMCSGGGGGGGMQPPVLICGSELKEKL